MTDAIRYYRAGPCDTCGRLRHDPNRTVNGIYIPLDNDLDATRAELRAFTAEDPRPLGSSHD